uniref:Uncharacterized protein n=1 Tax=Zymoseptoria tritici TaxID=1047171 RepID=A0A3G2SCT9_ZYMTR|nr:hypothetical protein [Zymoseptoria tritici]
MTNFNTIPIKFSTFKRKTSFSGITFVLGRWFTTTNYMLLPRKNDQDDLIDEINKLEQEFNEIDADIEELNKEIVEGEVDVNSDGEETELSKWVKEREEEKDSMVGDNMENKDEALFVNNNERKNHSLTLELIKESASKDIETLNEVMDQCPQDNPAFDRALELVEKVEYLQEKASELHEKWHENDLPPMSNLPENSVPPLVDSPKSHFPQDSSDVEQTEFNSFEPFDE